eukprot:gene228-805_t
MVLNVRHLEFRMDEVGMVLTRGHTDYGKLKGPTGPIAYPAGFVYFFGGLHVFTNGGRDIETVQQVFLAFHMATVFVISQLYEMAGAPAWALILALVSKRVHSVFVLRLFNDPIATFFLYVAVWTMLKAKQTPDFLASLLYSISVSIKIHPLLYAPAIGLRLVLTGGWLRAIPQLFIMVMVQIILATPFLMTNAGNYFRYAFGGPGALQQVWSVNWKFLPAEIFYDNYFKLGLFILHVIVLAIFAAKYWIPGGVFSKSIRTWKGNVNPLISDDRSWVAIFFTCVCFLRTMHFQFCSWYWHTVPFLAWFASRSDNSSSNIMWAVRCAAAAIIAVGIEVSFLLTQKDTVQGPDGRKWTSEGTPRPEGAILLTVCHFILLALLFARGLPKSGPTPKAGSPNKKSFVERGDGDAAKANDRAQQEKDNGEKSDNILNIHPEEVNEVGAVNKTATNSQKSLLESSRKVAVVSASGDVMQQ